MRPKYEFDEKIEDIFGSIKEETYRGGYFSVPVYKEKVQIAVLDPITKRHLGDTKENRELIRFLSECRELASAWYPSIFKVTEEGTKKWLKYQVIDVEDRILFIAETIDGVPFGHMGFYRGEADNFIRGRMDVLSGGMTYALNAMLKWAFCDLDLKDLYLRVFSDNYRAIAFYKRCSFKEIDKIPLRKIENRGIIKWEEIPEGSIERAERFFSVMHLKNPGINRKGI